MSHQDNENDIDNNDEFFNMVFTDAQTNNSRIAVRYIRTDITTSLTKPGLFSFSKKIPVKLLDISSKGACIECELKLRIKRKTTIELIFKDNHSFNLNATIVHRSKNKNQYGLRFDKFNHDLGDYLLSTQKDFTFK